VTLRLMRSLVVEDVEIRGVQIAGSNVSYWLQADLQSRLGRSEGDPKATLEQFAYASGTMVLSGAAPVSTSSLFSSAPPSWYHLI
jgi:hypothetical protein